MVFYRGFFERATDTFRSVFRSNFFNSKTIIMKHAINLLFLFLISICSFAQSIGIGTTTPNSNAKLDISDSTKGLLIPRLDSFHRKQIANTKGLLVYDTNYNSFWYNNGLNWVNMNNQNSFNNTSPVPILQPIDADGNVYPITKIGSQIWMASNLKTTHFSNGDSIDLISNAFTWTNTTSPAFCFYNNDSENNNLFGKLYNYYAVKDTRGLCPYGWHIPSDSEWTVLRNHISGYGNLLKVAGVKYWQTLPATSSSYGNNQSGFSALPAGKRSHPYSSSNPVTFTSQYFETLYWSTNTQISQLPPYSLYVLSWFISSDQNVLYSNWIQAESGLSCRCIKD
jgi:uncharacterized protein (TIGR02145 family)